MGIVQLEVWPGPKYLCNSYKALPAPLREEKGNNASQQQVHPSIQLKLPLVHREKLYISDIFSYIKTTHSDNSRTANMHGCIPG